MFVRKQLGLLLLLTAAATNVSAQGNGSYYAGLKAGRLLVDIEDYGSTAYGLQLGYGIGPRWTLEFEYLQGETDVSTATHNLKLDHKVLATYAAFRSGGTGYFLGKMGLVNEHISSSNNDPAIEKSDIEISAGLGSGIRFGRSFSTEVEYSFVGTDTKLLGITARIMF